MHNRLPLIALIFSAALAAACSDNAPDDGAANASMPPPAEAGTDRAPAESADDAAAKLDAALAADHRGADHRARDE